MSMPHPPGVPVIPAVEHFSDSVLDQLLEHSHLLVAVKDENLRYRRVSRRMLDVFRHFGCEDPSGRTVLEILPQAYAREIDRQDRLALRTGVPTECEGQLEVDGSVRTYLFSRTPLYDADRTFHGLCVIATEITVRKRTEDALRDVAIGVSAAGGEQTHEQIVRFLANTLGVAMAMIGVLDEEDTEKVRTLAIWHAGGFMPNLTYALAGTPCQYVIGRAFEFVPERLRERFPGDDMMHAFGFESYAAYPLFDSRQQPLGIIAIAHTEPLSDRELTESILKIFSVRAASEVERARADHERRISEASYRNIFEATEDCIFIHDFDTGAILDVNPKACETYGYSREEMRRLDVGQLSSGEYPYTLQTALGHIERAKAGEIVRVEWHRRNKDGSLHWDEVVLKTAVLAGRKRLLAVTRDITERKRTEAELRAREEQYRAIFNASVDGMVLKNSAGRIVDVNPAFTAMHGYSRDEMLAMDPHAVVHPDSYPQLERFFDTFATGQAFHGQARNVRRDGSVFDVEVNGVLMDYQGEPHLLAIVRDITGQREAERARTELERQLRQAQKMEAIGHLTGGIAHDFNNILTSVLGYTLLAREQACGDERLTRYLDQVQVAGERARDLIRQMLTFSRGKRGEPRPLHLGELVKEAVRLFGSTFPSTIEFVSKLDTTVPAVHADPVLVEQVLINLCINARDAMEARGSIRIRLQAQDVRAGVCASCRQSVEGRFVELTVTDTGTGIETQVLERMFEPFFTTKEVGRGSGMGLSTVHGIIHEHQGHLLVESTRGAGSTFRVLFPPAAGTDCVSATKDTESLPDAVPGESARLLVADDEASVREFLRDLLEGRGFSVTTAANGEQALALLTESPGEFDLLITDQIMPRLTGLALAEQLKERGIGVPVLLCSGYSEGLDVAQARASGVDVLLRKPFETRVLFDSIHSLLGKG